MTRSHWRQKDDGDILRPSTPSVDETYVSFPSPVSATGERSRPGKNDFETTYVVLVFKTPKVQVLGFRLLMQFFTDHI